MDFMPLLAVALAALALAGGVILALLRTIAHLSRELAKLAARRPYYVIETDQRGIRQIGKLPAAGEEAPPGPPPGMEPEPETPGVILPDMRAAEEPVEIGERHL